MIFVMGRDAHLIQQLRNHPLVRVPRQAVVLMRFPPKLNIQKFCRHAVSAIEGFTDYKRWLVMGGMLELPMIRKLNIKLSLWAMSKVDVLRHAIFISDKKLLRFRSADVAMVFGIPCGNRDVRGPDSNINEESISFIKETLRMDQAASHSLRAAKDFLKMNITEDSSKLEKDCFQIAFVIFVMGHVLAPSCKHDYKSIDFWGALQLVRACVGVLA